jgi:transcription termination factor Rho
MNPEKAVDYLSRVNWKSLVEWLTAEVILNRPNDPIQFSRDILGLKLAELTSSEYQPENVTSWLRSCYTEASAMVDEHGVIHGKNVEAAPQSLAERCDALQKKVDGVDKLVESCGRIGTLDGASVADKVAKEATDLLRCSTAEVYVYEENIKSWVVRDSEDNSRRVRIPRGEVRFFTILLAYAIGFGVI